LDADKEKHKYKLKSTGEEISFSSTDRYFGSSTKCICQLPTSISGSEELVKSLERFKSDETLLIDEEDSRNSSSMELTLTSAYCNFECMAVTSSSEKCATSDANGQEIKSHTHSIVPLARPQDVQLSAFQLHSQAKQGPLPTTVTNLMEITEPLIPNSSGEIQTSSICVSESKLDCSCSFQVIEDERDSLIDEWQCNSFVSSSEVSLQSSPFTTELSKKLCKVRLYCPRYNHYIGS